MKGLKRKLFILSILLLSALVSTIAFSFFQEGGWEDKEELMQALRIQSINQLIESNFDRFITMPFWPGYDNIHLTGSMTYPDYPDYYLNTWIDLQDDLDILLTNKVDELGIYSRLKKSSLDTIILTTEDINQLKKVYLFKNEQDLKDLWYVVSSYRTRVNKDAAWRRDNIFISYRNIANVRVLNTQQTMSFMDEIHYNPNNKDWKLDTVSGLAIAWGIVTVKGWWICGASRGINTVLLTNKAFDILERYNHTRTYRNLYQNEINGKEFWLPGLDVAVYRMWGSAKDFKFKNIRNYPIVLIMNFDWTIWWTEELFVLSKETDRGELKYIGKSGNCYTREANGEKFRSCYKSVAR